MKVVTAGLEFFGRLAGNRGAKFVDETGELAILAGRSLRALVTPPWDTAAWLKQMEQIGVRSLGVAASRPIFTGMVLALQTALALPGLGVKYYIGTVVSKSLVRELGPVLMALIVGGRIGSGMTAEIGTMKVTEQIDALRSMAADPVQEAGRSEAGRHSGHAAGADRDRRCPRHPRRARDRRPPARPDRGLLSERRAFVADPGRRGERPRQVVLLRLLHHHRRLLQRPDTRKAEPTASAGRPPTPSCWPSILVLVSDFFLTKLFSFL